MACVGWLVALALAPHAAAVPQLGVNDWRVQLGARDLATIAHHRLPLYRVKLSWAEVESARGVHDWAGYDRLMARAACARVRLLPVLLESPGWAADDPLEPPDPGVEQRHWNRWAEAAVRRYRGWRVACPDGITRSVRLGAVQVWNEPNTRNWWPRSPRRYGRFLLRTRRAVARADSDLAVIAAGLTHRGIPPHRFIRRALRAPVRRYLDGVAVHSYQRRPGQLLRMAVQVRRTLDRHGGRRAGLWVTELGRDAREGERAQGRWLARSVRLLWRHRTTLRLRSMLWFSLRDAPCTPPFRHCKTGLLELDRTPRPVWWRMVRLARR